jgi:hypothetical protein
VRRDVPARGDVVIGAVAAMVAETPAKMDPLCRRRHRRLKTTPALWATHTRPVGIQLAADGGQLELANCRHCGSSITRRVP